MLKRHISILIAAGVLFLGTTALAPAEEKGTAIRSEEQIRATEQNEVQLRAGGKAENAVVDQTLTPDRTQTRDRLRDGTGDHVPDRDRDRDRIHDHLGPGSGGMGGGMSGPRR